MSTYLLTFTLLAVSTGCTRTATTEASGINTAVTENRAFNDAARFLAGMPSVNGSPYAELEKTKAWQEYAGEMSEAWKRADARRLQPVKEFQATQLGGAAAKSNFVFYPFSGPDVVYMQGFYPNGATYVLAGLERPGTILAPADYKTKDLDATLDGVRLGSASLFERSFFVTGEMSRQMRGQLVDGVLPVLLMLLARTGNTVDNVRNVEIDDAGKLADLAQARPKMGERPDGLEVHYHKDGEQKRRKLYYFRLDLGPGLDKNASFLTFLDQFGKPETLIKSASFLLHWKTFTKLKDYIVANSTQIVQDDTGIRFETLNKNGWKTRLYGQYSRPDRPFQAQYQLDLRDAFEQDGRAKPLAFSMGYGTGRRTTIVMVANRP